MGEELTIHEGEAALGAVAREHSTPVRELLEVASSMGGAVEEQSHDGLEVEEEEKSCGTHHIHASHAGWLFVCSCEPAWPASRRKVRPAHRLQSFS